MTWFVTIGLPLAFFIGLLLACLIYAALKSEVDA